MTSSAKPPIPQSMAGMEPPIRLHLGGRQAKPGWKILNIQAGPNVDFVGSITDLSQFPDGSVAEIYGSHVLEHVGYAKELLPTLKGFWRVLAQEGRLMISVPDLECLARLFIAPGLDAQQKFHVMRMMFGGQIDDFDVHKTGFSYEILKSFLLQAGFVAIRRVDRFGIFADTSEFAPYGIPISLNVEARKPAEAGPRYADGGELPQQAVVLTPSSPTVRQTDPAAGELAGPGRKMRVLVVMTRQTRMASYHLPLGIGYISASLKRAGHDVRVLNPNHHTAELDELLAREIHEFEPHILAFGGMAFHMNQIRHAVATARRLLPHAVIVVGGVLVTNQPEVAMTALPQADIGVIGEGERTIVELVSALGSEGRIDKVGGLIYRGPEQQLKRTATRPIQEDLDALPWVDWEGVGLDIYAGLHGPGEMAPGLIVEHGARVMPIMTSRGCPHSCTFCCHEIAGRRYRTRSLDDVFSEIEYGIDRFGIDTLCIFDDLFCLKRQRLEEFCERIRPLKLRWECSLRVEQITPANLRLMKESGLVCISFGVESMSAPVLKSMVKQTRPEALQRALDLMYEAKLTTWANLIFGDPAETMATARESLEWMAQNNRFDLRTAFIGFHPGSRIYADALNKGLIGDPVAFLLGGRPEINATSMTDREYQYLKDRLVPEYVMSFGMAARIVELRRKEDGRHYDMRVVCPHCDTEQVYSSVNLAGGQIINRISCKDCNQLFRIPVRFRKKRTKKLKDLLDQLTGRLQESGGVVMQTNAEELFELCSKIVEIDHGSDTVWDFCIKIREAFGTPEQLIAVLRGAIMSNPYNPALFDLMAVRLNEAGRGEDAQKYIRQAAFLRRVGISAPYDIL